MTKFRKLMRRSFLALLGAAAMFLVTACLTNLTGATVPLFLPFVVTVVLLIWEAVLIITLVA